MERIRYPALWFFSMGGFLPWAKIFVIYMISISPEAKVLTSQILTYLGIIGCYVALYFFRDLFVHAVTESDEIPPALVPCYFLGCIFQFVLVVGWAHAAQTLSVLQVCFVFGDELVWLAVKSYKKFR